MNRVIPLIGISLGYFMVLLDMSVLSVAEPDLAASLDTSMAGLQWATTGYTVVFGALLLSAGAVADRFGDARVFRWGVLVFGLVSLASAAAPDLGVLVGLRALLGAAAAACVPASLSLVARLYPVPAERGKAMATWAAVSGAAVAAGPLLGGLLVDLSGWRAIFVINAPIAVVVLAMTTMLGNPAKRAGVRIDWAAQLAACVALAALTDALVAAGAGGWAHAAIAAAITAVAVAGFVVLERRSDAPVLNRALLGSGGVRAGLAAGAAVNFALSGALFVLPLVLQGERRARAPCRPGWRSCR